LDFVFQKDGFQNTNLDSCLARELVVRLGLNWVAIDEGAVGFAKIAHQIATVTIGRDLNVLWGDTRSLNGDLSGWV
jgi:hypothetical protein